MSLFKRRHANILCLMIAALIISLSLWVYVQPRVRPPELVAFERLGLGPEHWPDTETISPLIPVHLAQKHQGLPVYAVLLPQNLHISGVVRRGQDMLIHLRFTEPEQAVVAAPATECFVVQRTAGSRPNWRVIVQIGEAIYEVGSVPLTLKQAISAARDAIETDFGPTSWGISAEAKPGGFQLIYTLDFSCGETANRAGDGVIRGYLRVDAFTGTLVSSHLERVEFPGTSRLPPPPPGGYTLLGWIDGETLSVRSNEGYHSLSLRHKTTSALPTAPLLAKRAIRLENSPASNRWVATISNAVSPALGGEQVTRFVRFTGEKATFEIDPWHRAQEHSRGIICGMCWLSEDKVLLVSEIPGPTYGDWWTHYRLWLVTLNSGIGTCIDLGPVPDLVYVSPDRSLMVMGTLLVAPIEEFIRTRQRIYGSATVHRALQ